jgi:hypothetical protein
LQGIGTVMLGQYLARKLYGPKKPKLSDLPFDRFGLLPDFMLNKPVEAPKPDPAPKMTEEERHEMWRQFREACPEWFPTPPAIPSCEAPALPPPRPILLLPRPDKPHSLLRED